MKSVFTNERLILCVIIINTMFIFADGTYPDGIWTKCIDAVFTLFFIIEAAVKIRRFGWKGYWEEEWNKFDFLIVVLAFPSLCNLFADKIYIGTNALFAFRVLRVFKSFLIFRYIPNISRIIHGLRMAVKSSILVCLAYVVFLIVVSIFTFELFSDEAPQFFRTPLISMYSMFRLFTIEGWYEIPEAVAGDGGSVLCFFVRLYFTFFLFVGGILGMSLVNSIFVDAMVSDNNDEVLEKLDKIEKEIQELKNK